MAAQTVLKSVTMEFMPKPHVNLTRLKRLMDAKGWGIGDLAQYSGIKYDTVYSVAKGRRTNTSADTLQGIAGALGTSTDYLLGQGDDAPPIQKPPESIKRLTEMATSLSDERREELLHITAALVALESGQLDRPALTLTDPEQIAMEIQAWLLAIERTSGVETRKKVERFILDRGSTANGDA